jgi:beta-1,4-mannosyltransferase
MTKKIRIAAFPSEGKGNPYIDNFYCALENYGIELVKTDKFTGDWLDGHADSFDILHFHWLAPHYINSSRYITCKRALLLIANFVRCKFLGKKIVLTLHNLFPHESTFRALDLLVRYFCIYLADAIIVHSKYAKTLTARYFLRRHNVIVMRHGHYIDNYPNDSSRSEALAKLGLESDGFNFLLFGAVRRYKGVKELLEQFVAQPYVEARLIIAGKVYEHSYKSELESIASCDARVSICDEFIADDGIQYFMNAANVVLFPFNRTLTSGSLMLAYSFMRPVAIPRLEALREYEVSGMTHFLHGSHIDFDALKSEVADKSEEARFLEAEIEQDFGWKNVCKDVADTFFKLMQS